MVPPRKRRRYPKKHKLFLDQHRHRYEELLEKQDGHCALCPRQPSVKRRLDLDHSHTDMRVRGLLCFRCNRALKEFMTKEWLLKAAKYVDPKRKV